MVPGCSCGPLLGERRVIWGTPIFIFLGKCDIFIKAMVGVVRFEKGHEKEHVWQYRPDSPP
eukprot:1144545-Pelagomonas_calceolata.AAC.9